MKFKYSIKGLDCPVCASKLAKQLEEREEISHAKINFLLEKLTVESSLDEAELLALVSEVAKDFSPDIVVK